jgi:excisionase family DNA binding protein
LEAILDVHEGAAYLRVNEYTLRRLAREGKVPAFKVGRSWRFHREKLDEWMQRQGSAPAAQPEESTVLVIDDDPAVADFVRAALFQDGLAVEAAASGEEALAPERQAPDAILLDLVLPGLSGPELLGELRRRYGAVPVAIFTAYADSDLMERMLERAPLTLLRKPCPTEQLRECLRTLTGSRVGDH